MLAAAIFDMDGLLIDSEPYWQRAHIQAVQKYGHIITADDVRLTAGRRTLEVVQNWIGRFGLDTDAESLCDEVVAAVIHDIRLDGHALPGVMQTLELFESHDIPLAIASSSMPEIIDAVMERLDLDKHVLFAYSAVHEPKGKPHPGVFLTTAKRLGVRPADCLVFEDALSGVRAAKAAGMKCIAVPEPANRHMLEFAAEADIVLPSLTELDWRTISGLFYD